MLDLLFTHYVEPELGRGALEFLCDYPPSQAALARIIDGKAARFELYINGLELCNGFWELSNAAEQRARFLADNRERAQLNLPEMPLDEDFFAHQHSAPAGAEGGGEGDISEPSPSGAEDAVPGDWRAILFFTYAQAPQVTHELRSVRAALSALKRVGAVQVRCDGLDVV